MGASATLFCVPELYYPAAQTNTSKRANVTSGTNLTGHIQNRTEVIDPDITTRGTGSVHVLNIANFSSCTFLSDFFFYISSNLISKSNLSGS